MNESVKQSLLHVTYLVREYNEAIEFFTQKLGFRLVEDRYVPEQDKRWVLVAPPGTQGCSLLLARASTSEQVSRVGQQTGGRVAFFLGTNDFWRDHKRMISAGVVFREKPREEAYGVVAVFEDLYGQAWDLIELKKHS